MKHYVKKTAPTMLIVLGLTLLTPAVYARVRHAYIYDDMWQEFETMREHMRNMHDMHMSLFQDIDTQKNNLVSTKVSHVVLPTVTPEITQDTSTVTVKIALTQPTPETTTKEDAQAPMQPLFDKKDVSVAAEDNTLTATITLANGKIDVYVDRDSIEIVRKAEIREEKSTPGKGKEPQLQSTVVAHNVASSLRKLPELVDIQRTLNTIKQVAKVENNTLILTLAKKASTKIDVA